MWTKRRQHRAIERGKKLQKIKKTWRYQVVLWMISIYQRWRWVKLCKSLESRKPSSRLGGRGWVQFVAMWSLFMKFNYEQQLGVVGIFSVEKKENDESEKTKNIICKHTHMTRSSKHQPWMNTLCYHYEKFIWLSLCFTRFRSQLASSSWSKW